MIDMDTLVFRQRADPNQFETRRAANSGYPHRKQQEDPNQFQKKLDPDAWELVEESNEGRFLEVNGKRAVELGLADANQEDRDGLKDAFDLEVDFVVYRKTATDVAVAWLNFPLITGLLFVIGLIALYLEFLSPGIGIGGLIGGLCFTLFFWSHFLGGTAGWLEVILFLAGLVFLAMEMFVIPGFGIAGISGLMLMAASILMASQDFVIPKTVYQTQTLQSNLMVLVGSGAGFLAGAFLLSRYLGKVPIFSNLMLAPPSASPPADEPVKKGAPSSHPVVSVGDWGRAESVLRPAGKVRFGDQTVDVVADGSFIQPDEQVKVVEISGNRILVVKA